MGLLTTYDKSNRVVTSGKVLSYSKKMIPGSWTYQTSIASTYTYYQAWEFRRWCSKTYMYVGMDLATATQCAQDAVAYYKRNSQTSFWNYNAPTDGFFTHVTTGQIPMADVAIQQVEGHMYNVIINVREEDCLYSHSPIPTPEDMFAYTNQRGYDEGDQAFVVPN